MVGIGGMPSSLALENDLTTRAGGSPEMGQEAGEISSSVVLHPLSPDIEISHFNAANGKWKKKIVKNWSYCYCNKILFCFQPIKLSPTICLKLLTRIFGMA